ncbi:protein FLX-like 1 [Carex rostrata]
MAARRGPHVIDLRDQRPLLGRAPPPPPPSHPDDPLRRRHHQLPPSRGAAPPSPAVSALEDRLAAIDREIQALLLDNQRLAAVHVALRQELHQSQQDLRMAAVSASRAREAKEAELREVVERSRHAEAAARRMEAVRSEIARVGEDVRRLSLSRDEMVQRLVGMRGELGRMRAENSRFDFVAKEINTMQHELQKGRAAIEFEKKAHADNEGNRKEMESRVASAMREIDKLRAELANTEKRAQAAAAANPGYPGAFGNPPPEAGAYGSYPDPYRQAQSMPDGAAQYAPVTGTHYNTQQTPAQR